MMTFLLRLRKGDLLEVARELRVEVNSDQTNVEIKDMILQNDKNDMETIKAVMEGILEEKEREFEEQRLTREYEMERLRLSNATETVSLSSADLERQGGTSQIRGSEREWEKPFERKKPIICYYCNEVGNIKPACPKLMKIDFETVVSLRVNSEDEDCFEKFKVKFEINGVERQCLRYTGSTIDLCASSWINENNYLGEYVLVKSPLDDVCHRLPLEKVKFKTKGGQFYTKAAVKVNSHPSEPYLLSNRTAKLIQSREKTVLMIDAMVTRNASKIVSFEKKREGGLNTASGFSIENADPVFPTQGDGTEPTIKFPALVEKNEGETAQLKNFDFSSEQNKCKDQHVLWERAKWGVS
ncbi:hypothetical protein TNCV_189981, partial [Trichonephila clavipes]